MCFRLENSNTFLRWGATIRLADINTCQYDKALERATPTLHKKDSTPCIENTKTRKPNAETCVNYQGVPNFGAVCNMYGLIIPTIERSTAIKIRRTRKLPELSNAWAEITLLLQAFFRMTLDRVGGTTSPTASTLFSRTAEGSGSVVWA